MPRARTIAKGVAKSSLYAAIATGVVVIGTPLVWLGSVAYEWGSAATRFAFRHKNLTAAMLLMAGIASYQACRHGEQIERRVAGAYTWTIETLRDTRISELERKLEVQEQQLADLHVKDQRAQSLAASTREQRASAAQASYHEPAAPALPPPPEALEGKIARHVDSPVAEEGENMHSPRERQHENVAQSNFMEREGYGFYYVAYGETLNAISRRLTGYAGAYERIAQENAIADPRALVTGQLLEIPLEICTRPATNLYVRVPRLKSIILQGDQRISDAFPDRWKDVIALNHALGLAYEDSFPLRHGKRIVYYEER